jgi:hypothetical protein
MPDPAPLSSHKQEIIDALQVHWMGLESHKSYFQAKPWGVKALDRAIGQLKDLAQIVAQKCNTGDAAPARRPAKKGPATAGKRAPAKRRAPRRPSSKKR